VLGCAFCQKIKDEAGATARPAPCVDSSRVRDTRSFAREIGLEPETAAIESLQSNGIAEAFVKTFKRDSAARMIRHDAYL